ncbi:MAG: EutN/CcmL family microcompartment protein [Propionibacteriaceae bacterium]|jgi:ethanolamine utilization protein EutN|nr:EutN/CcmL family microcompartment protein [Propionibacteriaceae bacterium]
MLIGKVIGNVWATRKMDGLNGCKLMVVDPIEYRGRARAYPVVAVDQIGAGVGETVLVVSGSSARISIGSGALPIDHVIVGVVDEVDLVDGFVPSGTPD